MNTTRCGQRALPFLVALWLGVAALAGCSGSSGGGTITFPVLSFVPAAAPAAGTAVARNGAAVGSDVVELEFVVSGVTDLFALDMTITYDASKVRFLNFSAEGTILGSDGAQTSAQLLEEPAGTLKLGLTRVASATGIDVDPTAIARLFTLRFLLASGSGSGQIAINDDCLLESGQPPVEIAGVACSGGTFLIN